jgi:anaerobic magnesium-protoporphyrin IX monomethyl ester cyclase
MKIVLADPPDVQTPWLIANHPNMGILYLTSYLREKMSNVEVSYLDAFLTLKEHLGRLKVIKPDLYGLSFSLMRERDAFKTVKAVKEKFPQLPIICGGPYPTVMAEEVLRNHPVDICVRGEGEATLKELVEVFQGKRDLEDVTGIIFRRDGEIVVSEKRALIPDLDTIPFPAWDLVDFKKYKGNYQYVAKPSTVMIASRGCPYDCIFCSNLVWKLSKPWLRLRSPANISEEIYSLYQRGIREISIRSDEFNPVLPWTLNVCREVQKLGLKDLFFQGNLRADRVTDELVREMKRSNFWLVQLGIESGNQRTLDGIEKKITLEQVVRTCTLLRKHGIRVYAYIMIYHAWEENGKFCYETPEDVNRTLDFVWRLKRGGLIDYISFSTTAPMPGSRLFEIATRHKVLKRDGFVRDLSDFYMELPDISQKAMKKSRFKGLLLQTYINLRSGHNCFTDWRKNWHKLKTLVKSI